MNKKEEIFKLDKLCNINNITIYTLTEILANCFNTDIIKELNEFIVDEGYMEDYEE